MQVWASYHPKRYTVHGLASSQSERGGASSSALFGKLGRESSQVKSYVITNMPVNETHVRAREDEPLIDNKAPKQSLQFVSTCCRPVCMNIPMQVSFSQSLIIGENKAKFLEIAEIKEVGF